MGSMTSEARVGSDNPFPAKGLPVCVAEVALVCSHFATKLANWVQEWPEPFARPSQGADFPRGADPHSHPTSQKPKIAASQKLRSHEKPGVQRGVIAQAGLQHCVLVSGLKPNATKQNVNIPSARRWGPP